MCPFWIEHTTQHPRSLSFPCLLAVRLGLFDHVGIEQGLDLAVIVPQHAPQNGTRVLTDCRDFPERDLVLTLLLLLRG